jgi:hypothetical protein
MNSTPTILGVMLQTNGSRTSDPATASRVDRLQAWRMCFRAHR